MHASRDAEHRSLSNAAIGIEAMWVAEAFCVLQLTSICQMSKRLV